MKSNANGKKFKRKFRWTSVLLVAFALFFVIHLTGQIIEYSSLQKELAECEKALVLAQAEYDSKLSEADLLNNDAYIERMAREKLGMVKQGETVVSISQPGDGDSSGSETVGGISNYDVDSNPE